MNKTYNAVLWMMIILLCLMTAFVCLLKAQVDRLESEIQAVEERAMEREMKMVSTEGTVKDCCFTEETNLDTAAAETHEAEPGFVAIRRFIEPEGNEVGYDYETEYVIRVLTAEAGNDYELCGCVAQALYNACEKHNWDYSPMEMMKKYKYTTPASWISDAAQLAWDEVFNSGVEYDCIGKATVFYAPKYCSSPWHESQRFVAEVSGIRFFEEVG